MICSDAQYGNIDVRITANQTRIKLAAIREGHLNTLGAFNNMGIGEDLPI